MSVVLGVSSGFHDAAAALVIDGRVVAALGEERCSRRKHDPRMPVAAARACLEGADLTIDDVDHVVFYERPLAKFERLLTTSVKAFPLGLRLFARTARAWLGRKLWVRAELARALGCEPGRVRFCDHHLSHAASAFLPSGYADAAIVTADGVGEWTTTAIYHGRTVDGRPQLDPLAAQRFPHSVGLLYSALTAYLGFAVNEGEYKVMGLASYGEPRHRDAFRELVQVADNGAVTLNMRYFSFDRHPARGFTRRLERLLGPARTPGSPLDPVDADADADARRYADVAATLQAVCEEAMLAICAEAKRRTGAARLCLAGGVALNCVANSRIAREAGFDRVYVHPAAGDAGGALGAALYLARVVLGERPSDPTCAPFLGVARAPGEVARLFREARVRVERFASTEAMADAVAERLAAGEIGGVCHGRDEWGPRALGARSVLADPRDAAARDRISARIKRRERFRPFAPAVLAERATRWFDMAEGRYDDLSPHMLATATVLPRGRAELPAVSHVDGTARVQTVTARSSPTLHEILRAFERRTGVGALLNTSMNLRGEPIVSSPFEAYLLLSRSELDFCVVEGCLIDGREARRPDARHAALAPT